MYGINKDELRKKGKEKEISIKCYRCKEERKSRKSWTWTVGVLRAGNSLICSSLIRSNQMSNCERVAQIAQDN